MGVFLYSDVPKELVNGLLNQIDFRQIPPTQSSALLAELNAFASKLVQDGHLQRRTNKNVPAGEFTLYASVPQEAADVLNQFEYPKLNMVKKLEMQRRALKYLRERGIPLRSN